MKSQLVVVVVSICFLASGVSVADVWYVNDDAPPGGNGLAWESALQTIQSAVAAADIYDEIWVAAGTYNFTEPKYGQQLYGGFVGTELNRLSRAAEYYATVTRVVLPDDSRVDGFNIEGNSSDEVLRVEGQRSCVANCNIRTGGRATFLQHVQVTLENCSLTKTGNLHPEFFTGDESDVSFIRCRFNGGNVFLLRGKVAGIGCSFVGQLRAWYNESVDFTESSFRGGQLAVECYENEFVSFVKCSFLDNYGGGLGGAIDARGIERMLVEDCLFDSNRAEVRGGAIYFANPDVAASGRYHLTVTGSRFTGNSSSNGAAICLSLASADLVNSTFSENSAEIGSCVYSFQSWLTAINCLFSNNQSGNGSGLFLDEQSELDMRNCTIWGCDSEMGGAIEVDRASQAAVKNTIVWACSPSAFAVNGITARFDTSYSCIQGGAPGIGNINEAPWLANPDDGDFRLLWGSPCIDRGTADGAPAADLDGTARPQLAGIDMGALEFVITDQDADGMDDNWETYYGLNPADPEDADEDADGDGVTNAQEAAIRNNPQDPDDCRDAYYVATDGNDTDGDGSETDPWATIGRAMVYAGGFSMYKAVNIYAAEGTYNEPVVLAPEVALIGAGQGLTRIEHMDLAEDEHYVVTGAEGAVLRDCTVQVMGQYSANFGLLRLDDVSMEISNVMFDGDDNLYSLGALISGTGSSETVIDGCTFRRLYFGVQAVNTAANVTNTTFSGIRGDAIFVRLPDVKKDGETVFTPVLGDATYADTTDNNMFRNVMGNFVLNMNNAITKAENNDWGVYTDTAIGAQMAGPVDYKPFVGEQADDNDDGDNGGCFAAADKALALRTSRANSGAFVMLGVASCLAVGSRRKKQ